MDTADDEQVDELRAEVSTLRERNEELRRIHDATPSQRAGRLVRSTAAFVLIFVGLFAMVLSPLAIFGRNLVLNTDRYVKILQPIASNPGVQNVVIQAVDRQVANNIDIPALVATSLPPRAAPLKGAISSGVTSLINTATTKFVQSSAFETLWVQVNRTAHQQLDFVLTGKAPPGLAAVNIAPNGVVSLDLSSIVTQVKARLVAGGLTVAEKVPVVGATIEIAKISGVEKARRVVRALNTLADWLPWVGLALIAAGIATARRRRRALMRSAGGLAAGMALLGLGLLVARHFYLANVPPSRLPPDTAKFLFDTLVRYLRLGIRLVFVIALLIVVGAWLAGPGDTAVNTRHRTNKWWHSGLAAIGVGSVRLAPAVDRHVKPIRMVIVAFGLLLLVMVDNLSGVALITIAAVVVALLVVVELIRRAKPKTVPA
jgi:hypothetical protein